MAASERDNMRDLTVLAICSEGGMFLPTLDGLRGEGVAIELAHNVYRAIAQFARRPTDAAIVDLDLLGDAEVECIKVLRELREDAYILAVFSQEHRRKAAEALNLGADATLLQPFYPSELLQLVKRWAQRAAARNQEPLHPQAHLASLARLAKETAHEINNPLTTISGWLELMESDESRSEEERRRLASLREEADRIAKVVEQLLAFGQERLEGCSPVDVDRVVRELVDAVRSARVPVAAELEAEGETIWGNEGLLRKAWQMLLEDSLAAVKGGGTLQVRTKLNGHDSIELSIRDNGRRIPPDELEHIFEPFGSPSRSEGPMVLAYPAVYGIMRSHGGALTVTSDEEHGTEFLVRLPRTSAVS